MSKILWGLLILLYLSSENFCDVHALKTILGVFSIYKSKSIQNGLDQSYPWHRCIIVLWCWINCLNCFWEFFVLLWCFFCGFVLGSFNTIVGYLLSCFSQFSWKITSWKTAFFSCIPKWPCGTDMLIHSNETLCFKTH